MSTQPPSGPPEDPGQGSNPSGPAPPPSQGQPGEPGQPGQPGQYGQPSYEQAPGQPPFEQGPGQPWGQPGVPPDGSSGKRNLLPFIVAGAVIVVIAVVLLVVLVANSGGSSGSPQDTAEDFVAAAKAGDCDKALALITDKLAESENANCDDKSEFLPAEDSGVEFGDVKVTDETDDTATATVDVTFSGQSVPLTMKLVNEDGDWLIDSIGS
jgi:hypothetical protein